MSLKPSIIARNEPALEVFRTLQSTCHVLQRRSDSFIQSYDLTRPQFEVVAALGASSSGMTLKELAQRVPVTKGTLSGVITRLEERGLVHRQPSDSDRRSTVATLTAQGCELFEDVFSGHVAYLKKYFDDLSPREREELNRLLMRIQVAAR